MDDTVTSSFGETKGIGSLKLIMLVKITKEDSEDESIASSATVALF